MNSRSCRWLIVSALLVTASGAWAQRSAPPASDQKEQTVKLCSKPPGYDQKSITAFKQQAASGDAHAQYDLGVLYNNGQGVPHLRPVVNVRIIGPKPLNSYVARFVDKTDC